MEYHPWIKVAYSQTFKTILENLNFIPGKYLGMLPNHPNPLAATLTTGLVGAGLGYGAGRLAKAIAPDKYGDNLPLSLALLGGFGGAGTAGLIRGYPSLAQGKSLSSNWPFSDIGEAMGTEAPTPSSGGWDPGKTIEGLQGPTRLPPEPKNAPPKFKFKETRGSDLRYKYAQFDSFAPSIPMPAAPTPFDIHVNA
jgi:hypothetical protein